MFLGQKRNRNTQCQNQALWYVFAMLYRRVALDTIGLDNEALLGTDVLHGIKFNLDNKHQKRNRDFNALLYFLKNRMNERTNSPRTIL